ncbi:MAG: hybrid sensor histidine kinase/response regulator [Candidatus Rokuibacteriota bacterium]|nr:MAG: hybrid sensor histidine kinase/response regulator [Candidatus Rokubacteria bacterium]
MPKSRILVVEDEILVREDIEDCLAGLGHEVVSVASTGADALRKIPTARPDLVLMDIRLKGDMDGVETARQIRTNFRLPVIFLTAHADDSTLQRAKAADPLGYIVKPFAETTVNAVIQTAMHKHELDRRLRESEEWLTTTLGSIGEAVLATDSSRKITFMNPVAEGLTGWSAEEAMGKDVDTVFPLKDGSTREPIPSPVATILRDGKGVELTADTILVCRDGSERQIADSACPIKDKAGNVTGTVLVFRDTSERLRAAEALRELQKMDAVGRLAGGVAHEFNNLLTVINGYAQQSLNKLTPANALHTPLLAILTAGERAGELTRQLLAFSHREINSPRVIDLNALIVDYAKVLRSLLGDNVELCAVVLPSPLAVKADSAQLEEVLMNLAVNARDAMPEGGRLTIETAAVTLEQNALDPDLPAGPYALLTVSDTGCGMTAEVQQHLFEPFFTTKDVGQGTGLSLAAVYGIVQQHQGNLRVRSQRGEGTTFRIYLPRLADVAETAEPPKPPMPKVAGSGTILLVDDEPLVRGLARDVLVPLGYNLLHAEGGPEALLICAAHPGPIHLLLTDVSMPGMNGRVVSERARQLRPGLRVMYMSGYCGGVIDSLEVLKPGDEFIVKPFTAIALASKVRELLGPTGDAGDAAPPGVDASGLDAT